MVMATAATFTVLISWSRRGGPEGVGAIAEVYLYLWAAALAASFIVSLVPALLVHAFRPSGGRVRTWLWANVASLTVLVAIFVRRFFFGHGIPDYWDALFWLTAAVAGALWGSRQTDSTNQA